MGYRVRRQRGVRSVLMDTAYSNCVTYRPLSACNLQTAGLWSRSGQCQILQMSPESARYNDRWIDHSSRADIPEAVLPRETMNRLHSCTSSSPNTSIWQVPATFV
jgi:hypothetical protein